ncbi:MAG TPA: toll/interleukin-1 receptor domain-containing protein, partial [Aggregatilineales bacterium]|nr:toll/interleukin-1 receptor domain-containing protein [Aggregatilineales bacterium]
MVLQVVCEKLWNELPPDTDIISQSDVAEHARVLDALMRYYDDCLMRTIRESGIPTLTRQDLQVWFDSKLITPAGTRARVFQDATATGGLPNPAVRILEDMHIIRGEQRDNARWYELSHDRFIQPIRKANEEFQRQQQLSSAEQARSLEEAFQVASRPIADAITEKCRVFMSYAPHDGDFVRFLESALTQQGFLVELSREQSPPAEMQHGIENADVFVPVLSAEALTSEQVHHEIENARSHNKRIVPILRKDVSGRTLTSHWSGQPWYFTARNNWDFLSGYNWIFFRENDEFEPALQNLVEALNTDFAHVRLHTQLHLQAVEWQKNPRNSDLLLDGEAL